MTNFVRDDTPLWDDKIEVNPVAVRNQEWGASEAALTKGALEGVKDYLRSGVLDAAAATTLQTATIATANVTTANLTNANVTALVAADLNLTNNLLPSVGPELDWIGHRADWFVGIDVANTPTSRDFVLTGQRGSYAFSDGAITNGSAVVTSAAFGGFTTALVGAAIAGIGIPVGATVLSVGGPTSLTMTTNATATASSVNVVITRNAVQDLLYWRHRGALSATLGIGVTPPDGTARVQVSAQDDEPAMGTLRLRVGPTQTGKALTVYDSGAVDRWWVDSGFYISGNHPIGGAMIVQSTAATPGPTDARALVMVDNAKSNAYGFTYQGGNAITFRAIGGGSDSFKVGTDGLFTAQGSIRGTGTRAAAPSTGTHVAGEVVLNADPIAGGKIGWACVTGGSPGTWKAFGAIDP